MNHDIKKDGRKNLKVTRRCVEVDAIVCILALTSCSSALVKPLNTADDDVAKSFQSVPNKAVLYVYRGSVMGGDYATDLQVNGKSVARGAYHRYSVLTMPPGQYELRANVMLMPDRRPVTVDLVAGDVRFLEELWKIGGFSLEERSSDKAKATIRRLPLASRVDIGAGSP